MNFAELVLTALALAMDAVAVSIASGLSIKPPHALRVRDALKMAAYFGAFQAIMPLLGYLLGLSVAKWIDTFGGVIAFVVLMALGLKMIYESRSAGEEKAASPTPFGTRKLITLAIATSLDAFAVGVSFSLLQIGLAPTVLVIGVITFVLCLPAVWFGSQFGPRLGKATAKYAEVLGGIVLIGIGCKLLIGSSLVGK